MQRAACSRAARASRRAPAASVLRHARTPRAAVVQAHRVGVGEGGFEDPPLLVEGVGPPEPAGVADHGVLEEPLVRLLALAEDVVEGHLEVDRSGDELVARHLRLEVEHHAVVPAEPEAEVVGVRRGRPGRREQQPGRGVELDDGLGGGDGQVLAGADEPRHARPAPRVDLHPEGDEGLDVGRGVDARLLAVAAVLAPDDGRRLHGPDLAEQLAALVAERAGVGPGGRLHGEQRHHLEEVVLHDVAEGAHRLVEPAPPLHAEGLRHRDLHAGDEAPVPDRLEHRVGEPEHEQVLDRLLAEEVVDAEDRRLREGAVEDLVELLGRGSGRARRASRPRRVRPRGAAGSRGR